jgi:hypothetical protein
MLLLGEELRLRTDAPGKSPGEPPSCGVASGSSVASDPIFREVRHDRHRPSAPESSIPQTEHLISLRRSITPPARSSCSAAHGRYCYLKIRVAGITQRFVGPLGTKRLSLVNASVDRTDQLPGGQLGSSPETKRGSGKPILLRCHRRVLT